MNEFSATSIAVLKRVSMGLKKTFHENVFILALDAINVNKYALLCIDSQSFKPCYPRTALSSRFHGIQEKCRTPVDALWLA